MDVIEKEMENLDEQSEISEAEKNYITQTLITLINIYAEEIIETNQ